VRAPEAASAPVVSRIVQGAQWPACGKYDLDIAEPRMWVEIPAGFTEMQAQAPDVALEWRMATRAIFTTYFGRGYRAVDFVLDRAAGRGRYLLARRPA
jgi:predicted GNAT superfamily acetyltransferase